MRDEFLSEDDPDPASFTDEELYRRWDYRLRLAQAINEEENTYFHGVFVLFGTDANRSKCGSVEGQ